MPSKCWQLDRWWSRDCGNARQYAGAWQLIESLSSTLLGSMTTKKDGITTVIAGTATIVSDARLNRLIVQGTTADVAVIDEYMKIVEKDSSITAVENSVARMSWS